MSKWDKVPKERREKIFAYNRQRAADSEAAADMQELAQAFGKLPWGQLKKLLNSRIVEIFAKYGVGV